MGITGVERCMHLDCPGGVSEVNIRDLVSTERNEILVDGNQFYKKYLFYRYDWILGGLQEFVEEIRKFVEKFKEINVNLIFFFGRNVTEPDVRENWIGKKKKNTEYSKKVLDALSKGKTPPERDYVDRPLNAKYLVIYFLHKVMKCKVRCVRNLEKESVTYATEHNSIAILSQNSFYIFFEEMPAYLSFKALDLEKMTTLQYNIHAFWKHLQLEQKFLPLLTVIVGDNKLRNTEHPLEIARQNVKKIVTKKMNSGRKTCYLVTVCKFINTNFVGHNLENVSKFMMEQVGVHGKELISSYDDFKDRFNLEKTIFSYPNNSWGMILEHAEKLYSSGEICTDIYEVLNYNLYEHHTILEDFKELQGSGRVYRGLRQQLYGILLYEASEENRKVEEWCVEDDASTASVSVSTATVNTHLHPGLLCLWDTNNSSADLQRKRWHLFAETISPSHNLDYNFLCNLPRNLVIAVAVLFYLQHEVPKNMSIEKLLEPWEVEVLVAVAMMLPRKIQDISKIKISPRISNIRAVKLSAFFMCGCHIMHAVAQACGLQKEVDSLIVYYDGKLFHNLYEKAKWQRSTKFLESEITNYYFNKIKQVLL